MSGDEGSGGWQLTESDPGVFSELLKTLGVNLIVDDLYSLDSDSLSALQPIRALIFLFKWVSNTDASGGGTGAFDPHFPGFFAHQVVNNACATLAVLNALMNIPALTMGTQLTDLKAFTTGMDAQSAGFTITSSDFLRQSHNALSPPSAISLDGLNLPKESEDSYHFIVYIPVAGSVYELDGLKEYPVKHGSISEEGEGWVAKAREAIEARISTYPSGALEFNLMAIHDDVLPKLHSEHKALRDAGREFEASQVLVQITEENDKRSKWALESSLRRHNYLGFIHALTLAMAKSGHLQPAAEKARTLMKERIAKRQNKESGTMDQD